MWKKLAAVVMALMLAAGAAARAEGVELKKPALPVNRRPAPQQTVRSGARASDSYFEIECTQEPALGCTGSWTVTPMAGVDVSGGYQYQLCNVREVAGWTTYLDTIYYSEWTGNTFSYTFYQPIEYYLYVFGMDANGGVVSQSITFTVADDPNAVSVQSRVREIVAECRTKVSGDYATALWLHDWITSHSYYDLTYSRYGAEDILFSGCGVCDSYSKLYQFLLNEAGIENVRVIGTADGVNHAWNAVKISGVWCQIDATWDDPSGVSSPVSGSENHEYFGLNDEFMKMDHSYTLDFSCTSMACYQPYLSGEYRMWLYGVLPDFEAQLQAGAYAFDIDTHGTYVVEVGEDGTMWYYSDTASVNRIYAICATLLSMDTWTFRGGLQVPVSVSYASSTQMLHARVNFDEYTLYLPADTTVIGVGAFEGSDKFLAAVLSDSVTTIKTRAFANCASLLRITIPASVTQIADDAFDGVSENLVIVCDSGSAAETFAAGRGFATERQ